MSEIFSQQTDWLIDQSVQGKPDQAARRADAQQNHLRRKSHTWGATAQRRPPRPAAPPPGGARPTRRAPPSEPPAADAAAAHLFLLLALQVAQPLLQPHPHAIAPPPAASPRRLPLRRRRGCHHRRMRQMGHCRAVRHQRLPPPRLELDQPWRSCLW